MSGTWTYFITSVDALPGANLLLNAVVRRANR